MRLTFVCQSAAKLPTHMEASATAHTRGSQRLAIGSNAVMKIRRKTANAAAFGPAERKAETGVGAPWYTSGAHIWNGAADTLNASPTNISAAATARNTGSELPCRIDSRTTVRFTLPVAPYTSATP